MSKDRVLPAYLSRRSFLRDAGALALAPLLPAHAQATSPRAYALTARVARVALVGEPHPATEVWCYDGRVPGPEIRVRQGERLRVALANALPQETTIHWHGVRLPNAMDGVPHVTQPPVAANGGKFVYEFDAVDAGTYWYHPHARSEEQVGRGLYGALIVEERAPIAVDRDVTWMLGDWRLERDAQTRADFGAMFDVTHAGRIGNTVTLNGTIPERFEVRAGERIRLRLVNAATARVFALEFRSHAPQVVAFDGNPVEPHAPENGRVVLGPGERADVVIDMDGAPGDTHALVDGFYRGREYRLLDLAYDKRPRSRDGARGAALRLPANVLAEPDLARAKRRELVIAGGAMGGLREATLGGKTIPLRELAQRGHVWALNGVVGGEHTQHSHHAPLFKLDRGASYVFALVNDTAWHHPMHLHGHVFTVLSRNGKPAPRREWRDTLLLAPSSRAEIAFVADNPGDWMLHCHVLAHQAGGMMALVRVG